MDLYVLVIFGILHYTSAQIGDSCTVAASGQSGICVLGKDCPEAARYSKVGLKPTICGFSHYTIPILCCSEPLKVPQRLAPLQQQEETFVFDSKTSDSGTMALINDWPPRNTYSPANAASSSNTYSSQKDSPRFNSVPKRKSEQKCEEFRSLITESVEIIPLIPQFVPTKLNSTKCDYDSVPLVLGGSPAGPGEFPFMAALGYEVEGAIRYSCGGTLVSDRFVLTAAHCIRSQIGLPILVRLGDLNLKRDDDGAKPVDYNIESIKIHPNYKGSKKYNDIALLKLKKQVIFNKFIRPTCLGFSSEFGPEKPIALGWGQTSFQGESSDNLLKVELQLFDNQKCIESYPKELRLPNGIVDTQVCAGDLSGKNDTCYGDSGGPLLVTDRSNNCFFHIIGITSFGRACGLKDTPAIYTRVSKYIDWIEDNVWP